MPDILGGKRSTEKRWMRLQTSNVREGLTSLLSSYWMREFVVWIPILFLCFAHYGAIMRRYVLILCWEGLSVMCSYYVERDSFRVSLGRRCWPPGQLPSDSWPAGASLTIQTRLDVTHPVCCYPGLGLIDRSFIITKSVTRSRAGPWIMFQSARLYADPGSRGSQPSRRGLKRSRAVIGQEMGGELWLAETNRWMFPLASRAW